MRNNNFDRTKIFSFSWYILGRICFGVKMYKMKWVRCSFSYITQSILHIIFNDKGNEYSMSRNLVLCMLKMMLSDDDGS